ncbi:hypothetical protein ACJRO7_033555 [Eucalyptus globulus]|uniref:TIR domain-containing protein n=1 Tax=Eucalyptus globulus TaxID=34317 RepID=A0ABD3JN28_EUCGL
MEKPKEPYYDVFLSFRGSDTRDDITDYLYHYLTDAGIRVFRDNEELHVGEEIGPELLHAIKQSKISIPIFSKDYAASKWCLMELVQMVECKEKWGQKIIPIFYDVEPRIVRKQTATYGEAIQSHIDKHTDKTIQNWKAALNKVGKLKGCELNKRGKGEFTKEVFQKLLIKLKRNYLAVSNCLVEMDDQVDQIMEKIGEQTVVTKIVGIYGMGGVGKTTLATIVYNKLSTDFDYCCFLSNIREIEIVSLQKQLISKVLRKEWPSIDSINEGITKIKNRLSSTKVLLVLDDVDQNTQLNALVGVGECWFRGGSKVIITTRDRELLKRVDFQHELTEMDFDHSLQLFSRHAFGRDYPPAEYVPLSQKAVEICGHLPLALEIIGSLLYGNDINKWKNVLNKLKTIPNKEVKSKLNISFEALETQEQEIFLDVCCFFVGFDVRIVTYMWDICKFFPECSLEVLKQRSLIKIAEGNKLWAHDQLRDLGRDIVRERAKEKQSRVWDDEKAIDVLEIKEGRENIEAIRLKFDHQFQDFIEKEKFESLSKLRFLQVDCVYLNENNVQHFPSTNWFQRNPIMLPKLRFLSWHNFPILFQVTARSLMKLVILDLSRSGITCGWEGWNLLKMAKNLKALNLTGCRELRRTPDLSAHENLKQLILQQCNNLVQVDRSIGKLKHLVLLNLKYCQKFNTWPDQMEELEALTELHVDGTSITNIPEWKGMEKLETLSATSCRSLSKCNLAGCSTSLLYLDLSKTGISELPFGNFGSLVELNLSQTSIRELPNSIETMKNLRVLRMSCTPLEKLPSALRMLEKLEEIEAYDCKNFCGEISSEIGRLPFLRILRLTSEGIFSIPKLPESMTELHLSNYRQVPWSKLSNQSPSHLAPIRGLRKLESLFLCCDGLVPLPSDFSPLAKLRKLSLIVNNLECLPRLPQNLSDLCFHGRRLREKSIDLSNFEKLLRLEVSYCEQLIEIQGLEYLKNLRALRLIYLRSLVKLPDLSGLKKLKTLFICSCPNLVEVQGQLELLEELDLNDLESLAKLPDPLTFKHIKRWLLLWDIPLLEKLPDLTHAKELKGLNLRNCPRVVEIRGRLESVWSLQFFGCGSLRQFSDPSSFKKLEHLFINQCESLEEILKSNEYEGLKKVRRSCRVLPRFLDKKSRRKYSNTRVVTNIFSK